MPAAVAVLEGPAHIFRFHNDQYRRLVGASSTLVGLTFAAAVDGDAHRFVAVLDDVYRTGHPAVGTEIEIPVTAAAGGVDATPRFVNIAYVARRDAAGDIDGVIVHAVDVTELVAARERGLDLVSRLGLERERLHQVLEQLEAGVAIADAEGRILLANRGWRDAFEVPVEDVGAIDGIADYARFVGYRPDGSRYAAEDYPMSRALLHGEEVVGERIRFVFDGERERIIDISSTRLVGLAGDPAQAMITTIDMTEQIELQRELATRQEQELRRRAEAERRRAYEVNDTVLQRLAVADLAFDLGETDDARAALRDALAITKRLISEWGSEADDLALSARRSEAYRD